MATVEAIMEAAREIASAFDDYEWTETVPCWAQAIYVAYSVSETYILSVIIITHSYHNPNPKGSAPSLNLICSHFRKQGIRVASASNAHPYSSGTLVWEHN